MIYKPMISYMPDNECGKLILQNHTETITITLGRYVLGDLCDMLRGLRRETYLTGGYVLIPFILQEATDEKYRKHMIIVTFKDSRYNRVTTRYYFMDEAEVKKILAVQDEQN